MALYTELLEQDFARQIKFNHVLDYHNAGYKGNGIVILNAEGECSHRLMTSKAIRNYAPEATLLESMISVITKDGKVTSATVVINGEKLDFEQAIDKYHIKIVTRSYSGSSSPIYLSYLRDIQARKGVIFFNSAGNEPYENGVWSKNNTAISVSACKLYEDGSIKIAYYGSQGEVDFTFFMGRGTGTSAASPALAGTTALLLNKYGDFNQVQCVEILKSLCIDLKDTLRFGYGLPILPLTDKLEVMEDKDMNFSDVKETDWFYKAVEECVEKGLITGYEDGTFKPSGVVTRAELAVVLSKLLN